MANKKQRKEDRRRALLKMLQKRGRVVEIGVWRGDFSETILKVLKPKELILIDPWLDFDEADEMALSSRAGQTEMDAIYEAVRARFSRRIEAGQVKIARGLSREVIPTLEDGSVDVAYIDGDHSYEGVRADLEAILPKLAIGGVVACDDYHRRGWWKNGVIRAVNEFVGAHSDQLRLRAIEGAQVAVEKQEPMQ